MKQMPESTISRSVEIPLSIFGVWPNSSYIPLRRLFWMITIAATQLFQYRYLIKHFQTIDVSDLMDSLSATLTFSQFFVKLIIFWLNQRKLDKILAMMAMDWKNTGDTDFNVRVMIDTAVLSHNFCNFICGFYLMFLTLYSVSVLSFDRRGSADTSMRPFILKMDYPFDSEARFVYEWTLTTQFLCTVFFGIAATTLNCLLIALILHLAGQIDILRKWLTELFPEEKGYKPSLIMIRRIIRKHQRIIVFSQNIDNLYSYIALIMFTLDTFITCCIGFVLVTSITVFNNIMLIMKFFAFYCAINMETFMFCLAGEYLSSKTKAIGDAAYNSRWYQCNFQNSRIILFLIMRSQKQLTITMGKFMDLSLERFANFIKASASYLSVMLALYS